MSDIYVIPLSLAELQTWYIEGTARILAARLVPIGSGYEAHEDVQKYAAAMLPMYSDDFEVLFGVINHSEPFCVQEVRKQRSFSVSIDVAFERLLSVHPATKRAQELLPNRLPSGIILGEQLFATASEVEDDRRVRQRADRGGRALLTIASLDQDPVYPITHEQSSAVVGAARLRDQEPGFPLVGKSFIENLLNYDRTKREFPRSPLGFVFDYGFVARRYQGQTPPNLSFALDELVKVLAPIAKQSNAESWLQHYERLQSHLNAVTEGTDADFPAVACIAFLQMQASLREDGSLVECLYDLQRDMLGRDLKRELQLALYMTGAFFGFPDFSDLYYAEMNDRKHPPKRAKRGKLAPEPEPAVNRVENGLLAFRGGNKKALMAEPTEQLSQMIAAAVRENGGEMESMAAAKRVADIFSAKVQGDVEKRLIEAEDNALEIGLLTKDVNSLTSTTFI